MRGGFSGDFRDFRFGKSGMRKAKRSAPGERQLQERTQIVRNGKREGHALKRLFVGKAAQLSAEVIDAEREAA